MIYIELLIICLICVFVIDCTDFIEHIKKWISLLLTKGKISKTDYELKPISCSLCSTIWSEIIYLIIIGLFNILLLGYVCLLAFMTPVFYTIMMTVKDIIIKIFDKINETIK